MTGLYLRTNPLHASPRPCSNRPFWHCVATILRMLLGMALLRLTGASQQTIREWTHKRFVA